MEKKGLIIDAHAHILPREATEKAGVGDGYDYSATLGKRGIAYRGAMDFGFTVGLMDEAGVDMAVVHMASWTALGLEVCRLMNNGCARAEKEYPGRFIGCAHIPLDGRQETLDELGRAVRELGMKGVCLLTSTAKMTLDSSELFPLYEKIAQLNIPVVLHPTIRHPLWGGEKYGMSSHISREYDVIKATVEVLFGVLKIFPNLKFLIPHHGGGIPSLKGRIMAWFEPEGWEGPEALKNQPKTPRELKEMDIDRVFEGLFGKLYFDTAGFGGWMPITESATKVIRVDRLCFGTDYPFEIHEARDIKAFIDAIKQLDLSESDKRLILGENIKDLFKI